MPTYLDIKNWNRRELFRFFRDYDNPFFNICANVDVTALKRLVSGSQGFSFFAASLFLSQRAANEVEPFRYRIRGERVLIHEKIDAGSTVLRDDQSFAFAYFDYVNDFAVFNETVQQTVQRVKSRERLDPRDDRDDLVHYSVIPWISFTSFSHARRFGREDSTPKIVFGRYFDDRERVMMPVSVEVHHALLDGFHVGQYFDRFQRDCSNPANALGLPDRCV